MSVQIKGVGTIGGIDQGLDTVGVVTATSFVGTGVSVVGVVTATSFVGSGANLTGITGTTINNNANNRVITGSGTANTLEGEANLTFDGSTFAITGGVTATALSTFSASGSALRLNDGSILRLGNADADFFLYHDGSSTDFISAGAGKQLRLTTDDFVIKGANNTETLMTAVKDGAVELYHNNEEKLSTQTNGVKVQDTTDTGAYLTMATSSGIAGKLYATGNNTLGFLDSQNHYMLKGVKDGALELYHNGSLRAYTVSNALYVEQAEFNDDCSILINNKSTSITNNQKTTMVCRVSKDAGGSHGGTNRQAVFGHNYNATTGGGGFFNIRSNDGTNRDFYMDNNTNLRVNYGASNIGTTNGTVVGSQSSDIRNKNLVGDGTVSYGLSEILQLNPIKYQYKKELVDRIGFSAQQVESIIPESVYDTGQDQDNEGNIVSGDTIKAMYYVDLIPVLVNGIKELKAENDALKKRLDDAGL